MSSDPWVHELLKARVKKHLEAWKDREVIIHRFFQSDVRGQLLRGDEARGTLIIAGFGSVAVAEIDTIEAA